MPYLDIHVHILPGLDHDGPPDEIAALELARALLAEGYDTAVATPHCYEGKPNLAEIIHRTELLQKKLKKNRLPLRVLPGAEYMLEPCLLELARAGQLLTLNQTRYLLLELPSFQVPPPYLEKLLFELKTRGYSPVLAHPERVEAFQQNLDLFYRLVQNGLLAQLTLGSLTGLFGRGVRQAAARMLSHNLAHFLATDAHSPGRRLRASSAALRLLEKQKGPGAAALYLERRPGCLVAGERLDLPEPLDFSRHRRLC